MEKKPKKEVWRKIGNGAWEVVKAIGIPLLTNYIKGLVLSPNRGKR